MAIFLFLHTNVIVFSKITCFVIFCESLLTICLKKNVELSAIGRRTHIRRRPDRQPHQFIIKRNTFHYYEVADEIHLLIFTYSSKLFRVNLRCSLHFVFKWKTHFDVFGSDIFYLHFWWLLVYNPWIVNYWDSNLELYI